MAMFIMMLVLAEATLLLAAWSLRPSQPRPVRAAHFNLGEKDPFFRWFFNADGMPRRYAFCVPLALAVLFLAGALFAWVLLF